jgi:hypothetical protein
VRRANVPDDFGGARPQGVVLGPLNKLQVPHSGQLKAQVLQRFACAVYDRHIQPNVVLVDREICLGIHWISQTCKARSFCLACPNYCPLQKPSLFAVPTSHVRLPVTGFPKTPV